ncbi:MAG: DUF4164 family protein [Methylovirgula sp.]
MTSANRLDHALKRLTVALDQLEAATERRLKTARAAHRYRRRVCGPAG